jgi:hypothetical protein
MSNGECRMLQTRQRERSRWDEGSDTTFTLAVIGAGARNSKIHKVSRYVAKKRRDADTAQRSRYRPKSPNSIALSHRERVRGEGLVIEVALVASASRASAQGDDYGAGRWQRPLTPFPLPEGEGFPLPEGEGLEIGRYVLFWNFHRREEENPLPPGEGRVRGRT